MSETLIYDLRARDGKAEELLTALAQGRDFGLTVEGCEAYEVFQSNDDPHDFVMIERWATQEQQREHFKKNVVKSGMLDRVVPLMTAPPKDRWFTAR
ncbi:MAG: antibiotic biosynthesis monooxygenase family protein [Actinomycetota bacterium]